MTKENLLQKYDNVNPVTLEYLLNTGLKRPLILDVGCWVGTLGSALRRKGVDCSVVGIDVNAEALEVAKTKSGYSNVYCLDVNTLEASGLSDENYDVIVFGDVLEHIVDPGRLLRCLLPKLSTGGCLIVSLPNVAFLKYRLLHLIGNWDYTETGIMDKTHLRFFTLYSMRKLFVDNGLRVVEYKPLTAVSNIYWPVKLLAKIWPSMFALQIIFKLKLKEKNI